MQNRDTTILLRGLLRHFPLYTENEVIKCHGIWMMTVPSIYS